MLNHLSSIQIEMLKLFKGHLINDSYIVFINKKRIQNHFKDIPISTMLDFMEDLEKLNHIKIDWVQCNRASIYIKIQFDVETLEFMNKMSSHEE